MADSITAIDLAEENESFGRLEATIKTSEVLVTGGFSMMDSETGLIENADTTAGLIPSGIIVGAGDGNNLTGLIGDGTKRAISRSNTTISNIEVIGASALSDFGSLVYAIDNQTLTLTKPTAALPVGYVKRYRSGINCDITIFTLSEALMWSFITQKQRIYLGYVSAQSLGGVAAADLLTYTAKNKMLLTSVVALPNIDDAVVAGAQTFTVEIGAVNCTGTLSLGSANCDALADLGTEIYQALTGACTANQGDVITLEFVAGGTGFTDNTVAGFNFYLDVSLLPGS